jgi:SAM-dependent methyltransferase
MLPSAGQRYLNWRHRKCRPFVAGRNILDAPSGEGLGLRYLRKAKSITCLDYDANAVERAREQSDNVVGAVCGNMADMPLEDGAFDCVVSLEGLEHLDKRDGARFLAEAWRVLRPDGRLLLSCPVCDDGRHSGNEFHRHEWSCADLKRMLEHGFEIEEFSQHRGLGNAVWCVARRRETAHGAIDWMARFDGDAAEAFHASLTGVRNWLESVLTRDGAPLCAGGPLHVLPTCFAVLASECVGGVLDEPGLAAALGEHIAARQDPETGLFDPGPIRRGDLSSHSATYIRMQATYFALHALDALGASSLHPVKLAETFCDRSYLRGWLDGGPWHNPWLHSNNVMFALTFLERRHDQTGDDEALRAVDSILDYLDERQDDGTGLWQPDDEADVPNAVFAAYHFFPYYFWRARRPRHVERIIDSTLAIQQPDGLFVRGGGACEDLDAVHTLVMMQRVSDHRQDDVRRALERCLWRILQIQNDDGGFPNAVAGPLRTTRKRRLAERSGVVHVLPRAWRRRGSGARRQWSYSGWRALSCPEGASDAWAAWFRPLSLLLIADALDDVAPGRTAGSYRRAPGLGWHDASAIDACQDRSSAARVQPLRETRLASTVSAG